MPDAMTGAAIVARGGALRFAHGVNSRARLDQAIRDGSTALEADVCWGTLTGVTGEPRAIMAHPPIRESDLTFEDWFERAVATTCVVKIDLKDQLSHEAVLAHLRRRGPPRDRYFVNADMVAGPDGPPAVFSIADGQRWRAELGDVLVSIGSTTGPSGAPYEPRDTSALLDAAATIGEPVTLCLEVHRLERRPTPLDTILAGGRHVTLWNQLPINAALAARYRARLPTAFLDFGLAIR